MNILIFAPHPDDEVLGCGGIMAKYHKHGADIFVCIATCGHPPIFDDSLMKKNKWPHTLYPEIRKAHEMLGVKDTFFLDFPAADMESTKRSVVNDKIFNLIQELRPEIVYIPHFGDMQKDHFLLSESVMVAVRPKGPYIVRKVYAYETLSETEWNIPHVTNVFIPDTYVDISDYMKIKLDAMQCYQSQLGEFPAPRSLGAVEALARLRGTTMNAAAAEAFSLIREYDCERERN